MIFSKEELEKLDRDNLKNLAGYLNVNFDPRTRTDKLIDLILAAVTTPSIPEPEVPRYSARVKRIIEMKEKGEL